MLMDLWYVILAIAVSEFGSMVTSSWEDAKTGEIPPIAIKIDKNAIITIDFFNTQLFAISLINFTQKITREMKG